MNLTRFYEFVTSHILFLVLRPWKKKFLSDLGVINQCIAPMNMKKVNDQYLKNVALKINAKVFNQYSMINISFV